MAANKLKERAILNIFVKDMNEMDLAEAHLIALEKQDYEACSIIQQEVDDRIKDNTLCVDLFRDFCEESGVLIGQPIFPVELNGLFDKYKSKNGRKAKTVPRT